LEIFSISSLNDEISSFILSLNETFLTTLSSFFYSVSSCIQRGLSSYFSSVFVVIGCAIAVGLDYSSSLFCLIQIGTLSLSTFGLFNSAITSSWPGETFSLGAATGLLNSDLLALFGSN
jgi:ABC-type multidrug transport system permease subunit